MDNRPIPNDTWQCGQCGTLNLTANANEQCPGCGHTRDYSVGCCTNPGDLSQSSGLFPGYPEYQDDGCASPIAGYHLHRGLIDGHDDDMWHCYHCGADNPGWHEEQCPICGASKDTDVPMQYAVSMVKSASDGAGSAGDGVWICANPNCGSSNASFHWPQCGACGYVHN